MSFMRIWRITIHNCCSTHGRSITSMCEEVLRYERTNYFLSMPNNDHSTLRIFEFNRPTLIRYGELTSYK